MMLYLVISTVHCDWGSQLVRINRLMSLPFLAVLFCSDWHMPICRYANHYRRQPPKMAETLASLYELADCPSHS